jgi:hypothetical protein
LVIDLKIRTRRFEGRCARHKRYNPATDGRGGIRGGCQRCGLLADIYETALRLNALIRRYDPSHDDLQKPAAREPERDPRQLTFLDESAPLPT